MAFHNVFLYLYGNITLHGLVIESGLQITADFIYWMKIENIISNFQIR